MAGTERPLLRLVVMATLVLTVLVATTARARAALPGFAWPVQSLGNRGADVAAIQSLLRGHGVSVIYDAIFTLDTRSAVIVFQMARGLPQTGIVDGATWEQLVTDVGPGAAREPVLTLQRQLNEKRAAGLVATGSWNSATAAAVSAFERHVGLTADGIADRTVWRYLIAHFDRPTFSSSALCDYSVGNGPANWGTGAAIGQLDAAGRAAVAAGLGRSPVGDIGLEHGGNIGGHQGHELGLEVDIRPVRDNRDQCRWGTNWRVASYDRTATRVLIKAIRNAAPGHVKLIYFNDPKLIAEGWSTWFSGHDDHLHVRYCEVSHPVSAFTC